MLALLALVAALSLRLADHLYHRDAQPVLRLLRLTERNGQRGSYYKRFDTVFAAFPFVWAWCDVVLLALAASHWRHPLVYLVVVVVAGSRFRVLQEASHTALHGGLCKSRRWQWALSDVAAQWPCLRPDMHHRYVAHVSEHHAHANELDNDPNITRFIAVGIVPGISRRSVRAKLLWPLTPRGLAETMRLSWMSTLHRNHARHGVWMRLAVMAVVGTGLWLVAGVPGLLAAYVVPLVTVYPLFSWISVLAEHRWFVHCEEPDRKGRECVNGRPTDFVGLGRLAKHTIFLFTDHYHLAHSLYPTLRWNYLPAVDRALKEKDPRYARFASQGLFRPQGGRPSALSELIERLGTPDHPDVAGWARNLGRDSSGVPTPPAHSLVTG